MSLPIQTIEIILLLPDLLGDHAQQHAALEVAGFDPPSFHGIEVLVNGAHVIVRNYHFDCSRDVVDWVGNLTTWREQN